jgi:hypothetical protein
MDSSVSPKDEMFPARVPSHFKRSLPEINSSLPCKIAAPGSPREEYPELPDLSDNPSHTPTPIRMEFAILMYF